MDADADADFLERLGPSMLKVLPLLDERSRRLVLGMAARAAGEGGTGGSGATGASWQTVANGKAEADAGESAPPGRVRRAGGGRKRLAEIDPGLAPALEALVEDSVRGDPESPLTWTTRSAQYLAGELAAAGHPCSPSTCWRLLERAGYTRRRTPRRPRRRHTRTGTPVPVHRRAGPGVPGRRAAGDQRGRQEEGAGRELRAGRAGVGAAGQPVTVRNHGFPEHDSRHAVPYGVYDEAANAGFVNVGTDGNTAALAVESVRRWWQLAGKDAYPAATRLLVTCDAGGSNG